MMWMSIKADYTMMCFAKISGFQMPDHCRVYLKEQNYVKQKI